MNTNNPRHEELKSEYEKLFKEIISPKFRRILLFLFIVSAGFMTFLLVSGIQLEVTSPIRLRGNGLLWVTVFCAVFWGVLWVAGLLGYRRSLNKVEEK